MRSKIFKKIATTLCICAIFISAKAHAQIPVTDGGAISALGGINGLLVANNVSTGNISAIADENSIANQDAVSD